MKKRFHRQTCPDLHYRSLTLTAVQRHRETHPKEGAWLERNARTGGRWQWPAWVGSCGIPKTVKNWHKRTGDWKLRARAPEDQQHSIREMVAGVNSGRSGGQERWGGDAEAGGQVAAAGPGRALSPGETVPEAAGCRVLSLKPRHFRHQNANENQSAKIQLITSWQILFSLVNDFLLIFVQDLQCGYLRI